MRKGISLVALIITIIVLIILTAAVVLTGMGTPQEAQLAVFNNNVSTVQEAVRLKMNTNLTKYASKGTTNLMKYKWVDIVDGYTVDNARNGIAPQFNNTIINGVSVAKLDKTIKQNLTISDEEFNKYYVDSKGVVYHEGFVYEGITYYNKTLTSATPAATTIVPEIPEVKEPTDIYGGMTEENVVLFSNNIADLNTYVSDNSFNLIGEIINLREMLQSENEYIPEVFEQYGVNSMSEYFALYYDDMIDNEYTFLEMLKM